VSFTVIPQMGSLVSAVDAVIVMVLSWLVLLSLCKLDVYVVRGRYLRLLYGPSVIVSI
jgi:hypothetical protein